MARTRGFWLAISVLACIAPAAARQNSAKKPADQPNQSNQQQSAAGAAEAPAKSATTDANYVIGADDVLNINVWDDPAVSEPMVTVRPDGKISMPLLNDVQAAGLTPTQLGAEIAQKLKPFVDTAAAHPVTVIVTQILSQRVYVLGEVTRAGAYPMLPGMTVLQALSTAGGFTQFAHTKSVYVLRSDNGSQHRFSFNYKNVVSGKRPGENIVLKPGDQIVVP